MGGMFAPVRTAAHHYGTTHGGQQRHWPWFLFPRRCGHTVASATITCLTRLRSTKRARTRWSPRASGDMTANKRGLEVKPSPFFTKRPRSLRKSPLSCSVRNALANCNAALDDARRLAWAQNRAIKLHALLRQLASPSSLWHRLSFLILIFFHFLRPGQSCESQIGRPQGKLEVHYDRDHDKEDVLLFSIRLFYYENKLNQPNTEKRTIFSFSITIASESGGAERAECPAIFRQIPRNLLQKKPSLFFKKSRVLFFEISSKKSRVFFCRKTSKKDFQSFLYWGEISR